MRTAQFYNYTITEHGEVYNKQGKIIKARLHNERYEIRFSTPNGNKIYPLARAIYKAFNPDFDITDTNECITFKDNNKLNIHVDNLICMFRGDLIQGDGHRNRTTLTEQTAEQIRNEYAETINNRPVNQHDGKASYNSYRTLAKKYNVTYSLIKQVIEGKTRNKDNYILRK